MQTFLLDPLNSNDLRSQGIKCDLICSHLNIVHIKHVSYWFSINAVLTQLRLKNCIEATCSSAFVMRKHTWLDKFCVSGMIANTQMAYKNTLVSFCNLVLQVYQVNVFRRSVSMWPVFSGQSFPPFKYISVGIGVNIDLNKIKNNQTDFSNSSALAKRGKAKQNSPSCCHSCLKAMLPYGISHSAFVIFSLSPANLRHHGLNLSWSSWVIGDIWAWVCQRSPACVFCWREVKS